jgi:hypothetical protein
LLLTAHFYAFKVLSQRSTTDADKGVAIHPSNRVIAHR